MNLITPSQAFITAETIGLSIERRPFISELRTTLHQTFVLFAEILLYVCFAVPFIVDQKLALVSFNMPHQAELFVTVWPYFSLLHFFALVVGGALLFGKSNRPIIRNPSLVAYAAVNMIGIAALSFLSGDQETLYWDFALEFMRLFSLVILATAVNDARNFSPLVLVRGFLILLLIPLAFLIATNPTGFLVERGGRVNGPGLELTSTGHVAALAFLFGISVPLPNKYRFPLIGLAVLVLLLSGARIPFALALLMAVAQILHSNKSSAKRFTLLAALAGLTTLALAASTMSIIGGGHVGTLTGDRAGMETEYAMGRGIAFFTSIELIVEHPLGYRDSDWSIQEDLVRHGWPSHTHSNYFQSYLRYGPLILVFWGILAVRAYRGWRSSSPYASCLLFVLIGSAFDYYGCITKAMLLVFMLASLNEAFLVRAAQPATYSRFPC
jgi:hypothetical protein